MRYVETFICKYGLMVDIRGWINNNQSMASKRMLHNEFFIESMQKIKVAKSFMEAYLPLTIKRKIDLKTLTIQDGEYIDEDLKNSHTDILYKVRVIDQLEPMYLYLLAEHQSSPLKIMPLRLRHYMCRILKKHIKQTKQKENLPAVYPIVFYHGRQKPYPYSLDFFDMFADKELAKAIYQKPFHLVDVTQIEDEELREAKWARYMLLLQKHIRSPKLKYKLPLILKSCPNDGDTVHSVLEYIIRAGQFDNAREFIRIVSENLPDAEDEAMTLIEQYSKERCQQAMMQGRTEGIAEGEARGEARGRVDAMKAIARRMLEQGHSAYDIANIVGLDKKDVEIIKKSTTI